MLQLQSNQLRHIPYLLFYLMICFFSSGCGVFFGGITVAQKSFINISADGLGTDIFVYSINFSSGMLTQMGAPISSNTGNSNGYTAGTVNTNRRIGVYVSKTADIISSFNVDRTTGALSIINQISVPGTTPNFVVIDSAGKNAYISNHSSGSVSQYSIDGLGNLALVNSFAAGPNTNKVVLSSSGLFLYAVNQNPTNTISAYNVDPATGNLTLFNTYSSSGGAKIISHVMHPSNLFLYVVEDSPSQVETFSVSPQNGTLTSLGVLTIGSAVGSNLSIDSTGAFGYLIDQGIAEIYALSINTSTGTLTLLNTNSLGSGTQFQSAIDPSNQFVYIRDQTQDLILGFFINPSNGNLTPLANFPITVATNGGGTLNGIFGVNFSQWP